MNREEAAGVLSAMRNTLKKVYLVAIDEERISAIESAIDCLLAEDNNVPVKQPDPITSLVHLSDCMVCDKSHCKSFELEYYMKVKGPGGGYIKGRDANYCPMCGRKLTVPPRPGAIVPETGEMDPNGDENA